MSRNPRYRKLPGRLPDLNRFSPTGTAGSHRVASMPGVRDDGDGPSDAAAIHHHRPHGCVPMNPRTPTFGRRAGCVMDMPVDFASGSPSPSFVGPRGRHLPSSRRPSVVERLRIRHVASYRYRLAGLGRRGRCCRHAKGATCASCRIGSTLTGSQHHMVKRRGGKRRCDGDIAPQSDHLRTVSVVEVERSASAYPVLHIAGRVVPVGSTSGSWKARPKAGGLCNGGKAQRAAIPGMRYPPGSQDQRSYPQRFE